MADSSKFRLAQADLTQDVNPTRAREEVEEKIEKAAAGSYDSIAFELRLIAFLLACLSVGSLLYLENSQSSRIPDYQTKISCSDPSATCSVLDASRTLKSLIVLVITCLGIFWSGIIVIFAGKYKYPGSYQVLQPFQGGSRFVLQQAFGWCCYGISFLLSIALLISHGTHRRLHHGEYFGLSLLVGVAQVLLNSSLDSFDPKETRFNDLNHTYISFLRPDAVLSILVTVCSFSGLTALDWGISFGLDSDLLFKAYATILVLSILVSQYCVGFRQLGGFYLYKPFQGGSNFILLQAIGWTFFGVLCYLLFAMLPTNQVSRGLLSAFGLLGLTAHIVLLWSLQFYRNSYKELETRNISYSSHWLLNLGHMFTLSSLLLSAILLFEASFSSKTGNVNAKIEVTILSFVLSPPWVHFGAQLSKPGYRLIQPMKGGVPFVCLQAFGWFFYAVMLLQLIEILHVHDHIDYFERIAPFGIIAQITILVSVSQYSYDEESYYSSSVRPESLKELESMHSPSWVYLALRVASFSLELLALLITFILEVSSGIIPLRESLLAAAACSTFGNFFLHYSSRLLSPDLALFRPFSGTPYYIITQTIGWTTFAIALLGQIVLAAKEDEVAAFSSGWCLISGFAQFIAFLCLRSGSLHMGISYVDKRLEQTDHDPDCLKDIEELQILIKTAKREKVKEILERCVIEMKSEGQSVSAIKLGYRSMLLGSLSVVLAHISLFAHVYVDLNRGYNGDLFLLGAGNMFAVSGVVITHVFLGPTMHPEIDTKVGDIKAGFRPFQPFKGGFKFILLQSTGWLLFGSACVVSLIVGNFGMRSITSRGVITGLGSVFYASQVILIWSLGYFSPNDSDITSLSVSLRLHFNSGLFALGMVVLLLFFSVDVAIIRFGLSFDDVRIVQFTGWLAVLISVPSTIWLRRNRLVTPSRGSVIFLAVGCALWSFTVLIGLLLVMDIALEGHRQLWLSSTTGVFNIASHSMIVLSQTTNKRAIFLFPIVSILAWLGVMVFTWFVLPSLRSFLDYPMHFYAKTAKRWKGWISPDGIQGVHLSRNYEYCTRSHSKYRDKQVLDIMTPIRRRLDLVSSPCSTPLLYFHGGGHFCVTREILHHSVTPFVRIGMTVYSAEYPLSPEAPFPHAVLCGLRAVRWIMLNHCPNQCNDSSDNLDAVSHECTATCRRHLNENSAHCAFCNSKLGSGTINLVGDSAGGNLASMVTALICNKDLRERIISSVNSDGEYDDLMNCEYPQVQRLICIYGLLGRHTSFDLKDEVISDDSWLFRMAQYVGIKFVFKLYDHPSLLNATSTITDLSKEDLKDFAKETMLICGKDDPLLLCNKKAHLYLQNLGFNSHMEEYPGTHGFHGFPALWMKYLGSDWRKNALPATYSMLEFLSGGKWDRRIHGLDSDKFQYIPDMSPLIVFPIFFSMPIILFYLAFR